MPISVADAGSARAHGAPIAKRIPGTSLFLLFVDLRPPPRRAPSSPCRNASLATSLRRQHRRLRARTGPLHGWQVMKLLPATSATISQGLLARKVAASRPIRPISSAAVARTRPRSIVQRGRGRPGLVAHAALFAGFAKTCNDRPQRTAYFHSSCIRSGKKLPPSCWTTRRAPVHPRSLINRYYHPFNLSA